ncbi:MAG: Holliday junction DNA helicase RuvB [Planctomycetota bacterium]
MSDRHAFNPEAFQEGEGGSDIPEILAEVGLRPPCLDEFIGQERVVDDLRLAIAAATGRSECPDHVLFSGPPGLGKTTLARILATEMGSNLHSSSGPSLERPKDLIGLLTHLEAGDVLFIDEIHRIPTSVEEFLYTAMEDFRIDLTLDSGPQARVVPFDLKPFTLVGATTREGLLSAPFRDRFGLFERLDPYPVADLEQILARAAGLLKLSIEPSAARILADSSRGTPRIAGRFLRRARDLAQVGGSTSIDDAMAQETLRRLGVDDAGLEEMDRRFLRCLLDQGGGPVALKTISAVVGETPGTLEDVYEPHLLRLGLVRKTARGRVLSPAGWKALGQEAPATTPGQSGELFT